MANHDYKNRSGNYTRSDFDTASADQEAYWAKYTGHDVPELPNTKTRFEFDSGDLEKNEYVGTLPSMDRRVQALVDTLNLGKINRNYKKSKELNPELPSRRKIRQIYETGKYIMEHPNEWHEVKENKSIKKDEKGTSGLGALQRFGVRWNDKTNTVDYHDTYDFPWYLSGYIPPRERTLRIRGTVNMDPKKGSKLLRDNMKDWKE